MVASNTRRALPIVVGDVGGTNTRFGLWDGALRETYQWSTGESATRGAALHVFLKRVGRTEDEIRGVVVAVAGAVKQGRVQLTNGRWSGDVRDTKAPCLILNDLAAAAGAIRHVAAANQKVLASGNVDTEGMVAVLGLGTGHGQACRIGNMTLSGEGGHADFAPGDEEQQRLLDWMRRDTGGRVRVEDVLSGPGLGALMRCVSEEQELSAHAQKALEAG